MKGGKVSIKISEEAYLKGVESCTREANFFKKGQKPPTTK